MACNVLELRQYTLHPGRRDELIELFDREFVESQEALDMEIFGQFRDLDRPDRFVWLRGYPDMEVRGDALPAFYSGATWRAHSEAANATMVDVDDVLLLRPTSAGAFGELPARAPSGTSGDGTGYVTATIHPLRHGAMRTADAVFSDTIGAQLGARGVRIVGSFVTDSSGNNFPALPVRENDTVLVWFAAHPERLDDDQSWAAAAQAALGDLQVGPTHTLRLSPTSRSRLNGLA